MDSYYKPEDLPKLEEIGKEAPDLAKKFFEYYNAVFAEGALTEREKTTTLQINVGNRCNQSCRHCHLNAGPDRRETMNSETVDDVISYAARNGFQAIDITGGAPELNPNLEKLIEGRSSLPPRHGSRKNSVKCS